MEKFSSLFRELLYPLLIALSIFIPIYPKIPFMNVPGTYVAIRAEDLLILIVIFIFSLSLLPNLKNFFSQTINQSFFLFWFLGALSVLSGVLITFTVVPHLGLLHFLRRVEMMALFFVAAEAISSTKQVKGLLKVSLAVAIFIILYGFGQIYLGFPVISTTNSEFSKGLVLKLTEGARVNSTFAGHYDLAVYLSMVVIFLATFFFYYKSIYQKIIIALSGVLSGALLGLTAARISFVATFFSLALIFWLVEKRLLIVVLIATSIILVAAIPELRHRLVATVTVNLLEGGGPKYQPAPDQVNIFTPFGNAETATQQALLNKAIQEATQSATASSQVAADIAEGEPVNPTELGVYRSFNIRLNVEWPRAIRGFLKNTFLGSGYSSLNLATDNDILRALGETGILGLSSLFLIFWIIFKKLIRTYLRSFGFEKMFIVATLCSAFVVLATGLFIDVLEASKIAALFWIMLGASWAISRRLEDAK